VVNALKQGFKAILKINIKTDELSPEEVTLAKNLYENKYLTKEWNYKR